MAANAKKMEYASTDNFDVSDIPPDAPAGEWEASIPRGKCKIQPTKEHKFPMIIVNVRLDSTEEDGDEFQRALGTELSAFLTFGGKNPRAERMSKLRIRQFCEACEIDLDDLPKSLKDPENDLQPFIKLIEGKKLKVWTRLQERRETGEINTELLFFDPNAAMRAGTSDDGDDDDDDDEPDEKPAKGKGKAKPNGKGKKR